MEAAELLGSLANVAIACDVVALAAPFSTLLGDIACLRAFDVSLDVFFQKQTLLKEFLRGVYNAFHVNIVCGVPLLDRQSRISFRGSFGFCLCKVDFLPGGVAPVASCRACP
jgi:hypothetical protein